MKKIIVGKDGFIASHLLKTDEFVTTSRKSDGDIHLDLDHLDRFDFTLLGEPSLIIFLAAISSPDRCTNEYDLAYRINVSATIEFITKAIELNHRIIFFSSDVVLGERDVPAFEDTDLEPVGVYAKMKADVERHFYMNDQVKIFRLSYVFSKHDGFFKYLKNCIDKNDVAEIFDPFDRHIVYLNDVIEGINNLCRDWDIFNNQVFNICGDELISKKRFTDLIQLKFDGKPSYKIVEPPAGFFESRPKVIKMESNFFHLLLGRRPTKIKDAIQYELLEQGVRH